MIILNRFLLTSYSYNKMKIAIIKFNLLRE
jgi:hypothetical protein